MKVFKNHYNIKKKISSWLLMVALLFSFAALGALAEERGIENNTKNILVVVKSNINYVKAATVRIGFSSDLELVSVAPGDEMLQNDLLAPAISTTGVTVRYSATNSTMLLSGDTIAVFRFDTSLTPSEAYAAITLDTASLTTVSEVIHSGETAVTVHEVLLGDVNNNGNIGADDALLPQQYSVQLITLTDWQKLAADVNGDGSINSNDTLKINQYVVDIILTFWPDASPVTLPTTQNSNIVSGAVYRLENVMAKTGLNTPSTATSGSYVNQKAYDYSDAAQRYCFTYVSSGAYKITALSTVSNSSLGLMLSIVNGRLCVETAANVDRQRWYVVSTSSGTVIVNKAYPSQYLTNNGISVRGKPVYSGTSAFGNKWTLHGVTTTVENYYDNGMLTRWGTKNNDNTVTPLTDAQMRTQINSYMQAAAEIYDEIFGITLEYETPIKYTTSADSCSGYDAIDKLNQICSEDDDCGGDCKNNQLMWSDFRSDHPGSSYLVPTLWTGHYTRQLENGAWVDKVNMGAYLSHSIMMKDIGDGSNEDFYYNERIDYAVIHELAHEFGAPDSYCRDPAEGNGCPEHCFRHGGDKAYDEICIMATLQDVSNYSNNQLFCIHCKTDIFNHLKAEH